MLGGSWRSAPRRLGVRGFLITVGPAVMASGLVGILTVALHQQRSQSRKQQQFGTIREGPHSRTSGGGPVGWVPTLDLVYSFENDGDTRIELYSGDIKDPYPKPSTGVQLPESP